MLAPTDMAKALLTTRKEFARLFLQAQTDVPADQRSAFEAVAFSVVDKAAFEEALIFAQTRNFLEALSALIVRAKLEDGRIAESFVARNAGANDALQAMRNHAAGLPQPHVLWRGIADAMRWTCRVQVGGATWGTGFLVGPNLVLTAWHVVRQLFEVHVESAGAKLKTTYVPRRGQQNLSFFFDDILVDIGPGILGPAGSTVSSAADDWYVAHSACHEEELSQRLPTRLSELEGYWDYCVIRLKSLPGLERRWALLEANAVCPKSDETVFLFHHPAGQSMRTNASTLAEFAPPHVAAVDLRFLHGMNSLEGSSGGPCFDKNFSLFGIHQGAWQSGGNAANRGVPISRIIRHLEETGGLPPPDPSLVPILAAGQDDTALPIVGRDDLQELVWRSITAGTPRLISLGGEAKTGKTFCTEIIASMLPDGNHLKIFVDAQSIAQKTASDCARMICAGAGSGTPSTVAEDFNSTAGAFQKDGVVRDIFDAIEHVRNGRTVWLFVTHLNAFPIKGADVRDLLLLIYQQTTTYPWFRVVLDGFRGDLSKQLRGQGEYHVKVIEKKQIRDFLLRFAAAEGIGVSAGEAETDAGVIFRSYDREKMRGSEEALSHMSEHVIDHMTEYQGR